MSLNIELITRPSDIPILPCVNPYNGKKDGEYFMTLVPVRIRINGEELYIPEGFVTDLGSIPQPWNGIIRRNDESIMAYIIHDWIGKKGSLKVARKTSDKILRTVALRCGQTHWRAMAAYLGTRVGGWFMNYYQKELPQFYPIPDHVRHNVFYGTALSPEDYQLEINGQRV